MKNIIEVYLKSGSKIEIEDDSIDSEFDYDPSILCSHYIIKIESSIKNKKITSYLRPSDISAINIISMPMIEQTNETDIIVDSK